MTHLISSRDFARDLKAAKRAADQGPVVITSRGKPQYALLRYEDYERLAGKTTGQTLWEALQSLPGTPGIEFDPEPLSIKLQTPFESEPGDGDR
ncbi:MAG: type II toxin-antitoxin system Phd/YefM family antitoxin [Pirellulales bacterium]